MYTYGGGGDLGLSRVRLFASRWTVVHQAHPSMEISRPEYWNGWPFPSPGDLPNPRIEPESPALQVDSLLTEPPRKPLYIPIHIHHALQPSPLSISKNISSSQTEILFPSNSLCPSYPTEPWKPLCYVLCL